MTKCLKFCHFHCTMNFKYHLTNRASNAGFESEEAKLEDPFTVKLMRFKRYSSQQHWGRRGI